MACPLLAGPTRADGPDLDMRGEVFYPWGLTWRGLAPVAAGGLKVKESLQAGSGGGAEGGLARGPHPTPRFSLLFCSWAPTWQRG